MKSFSGELQFKEVGIKPKQITQASAAILG